jgi:Zn-dependent protease with chaperone function
MKTDYGYRTLVALFALAVACSTMSLSHWLAAGLLPFWQICCATMGMPSSHPMGSWLAIFAHGGIGLLLLAGGGRLLWRLWKTRRFVAGLRAAAVAVLPPRIARLVQSLGLADRVVVLATDVPLAFCYGLLRPRICISTGLAETLTDKELSGVLLHEDYHCRRYDPLRGLAVEVVAAMLFFLPVAAELRDGFLTATEVEADRYAVRLAGRPSLAGALHKIMSHPLAIRVSAPGIAGFNATEVRIAELLGDRAIPFRVSTRSLVSSSLIVMLACMLVL